MSTTGFLTQRLDLARCADVPAVKREQNRPTAHQLAARFCAILDLYRAEILPASPPVADLPSLQPLADLEAEHIARRMRGVRMFDLRGRRLARRAAIAAAGKEQLQTLAAAAAQQAAHQEQLDAWWDALLDNDAAVVQDALSFAFAQNETPAAPLAVNESTAYVVVDVPQPDVVPLRMPTLAETGDLSLRRLSDSERSDLYTLAVCSYLLKTAKEAFAVAPGLAQVALVAVRNGDQDADGGSSKDAILAARLERSDLANARWDEASSADILDAAAGEKIVAQCPQTRQLQPLPLQDYPDIAMALQLAHLPEGPPATAAIDEGASELVSA